MIRNKLFTRNLFTRNLFNRNFLPAAQNKFSHAIVFGLALLISAGGVTVYAKQRADAPNMQAPLLTGQVACVDMERVYAASGGPEQLAQRATDITIEVTQHLKDIKTAPMLEQTELQEYGTIIFKSIKTEAETARLKTLKMLSDQRQEELSKLQIKSDKTLTAEDKARMKQLQDQSRLLDSIFPFWQDDARAQQTERIEAFRRTQIAKLRVTIGKVAAERGITHVFDTTSLIYSANDVTPLVVQRFGKRPLKENSKENSKENPSESPKGSDKNNP